MSGPSDDTQRRLAVNENVHRRVNEAIERGSAGTELHVRCECGHLGCTELIALTEREYEAVRTSFERFLLVPDHLEPPDRVVEDHGRWLVVEKQGAGATVARQEDPRAGDAEAESR